MVTLLAGESSLVIHRERARVSCSSQLKRARIFPVFFASLSLFLINSRADSSAQAQDLVPYHHVHGVEQKIPMDLGSADQLAIPPKHPGELVRPVDGFGDSQEESSPSSGLIRGIGGLSGVGSNAHSRGSPNVQSPIIQDPCSKAITFVSNIDIDTDGRGNTVPSRTELPATSFQSQGRSLNSDHVNFIVMPGNCGAYLGRYASVTYRGETVYGIVGDCGPAGKTGEVSTAMAKELSDKLHSKGKGQGVPRFVGNGDRDHSKGFAEDGALYTIYPQGMSRTSPITNLHINASANSAASIAQGCSQRRQKSAVNESMRF